MGEGNTELGNDDVCDVLTELGSVGLVPPIFGDPANRDSDLGEPSGDALPLVLYCSPFVVLSSLNSFNGIGGMVSLTCGVVSFA